MTASTWPAEALALPVAPELLERLHGRACVVCGATNAPLETVGHFYTRGTEPGSLLGCAVGACPKHAGRQVDAVHRLCTDPGERP